MEVIIAKCPHCGEEVTTEELSQPLRLFVALAALMVHAASLEDLMQLPEYEQVRENWDERLAGVTANALEEAGEMQSFGEFFDRGDDNGDGRDPT